MEAQIEEMRPVTEPYNIISTGLRESASRNRNYGLSKLHPDTEIFIMVDDDITGFYADWVDKLVLPLKYTPEIVVVTARLLNPDGSVGPCMGAEGLPTEGSVIPALKSQFYGYYRLPTACLAVRNNPIRFDEGFIGSGYEDTAWCNEVSKAFPGSYFAINNECRIIHRNERKRQGGKYFNHNKKRYLELFPDDAQVIHQTDWCGGNEYEIPEE
jgi:hypothetical protein